MHRPHAYSATCLAYHVRPHCTILPKKNEKKCREADQKSAISENEELNLKWQSASVNVQSKSDSVENLKTELKCRKELLKGFEKNKSGKSGRGMSDKCDMPAYAIEKTQE